MHRELHIGRFVGEVSYKDWEVTALPWEKKLVLWNQVGLSGLTFWRNFSYLMFRTLLILLH